MNPEVMRKLRLLLRENIVLRKIAYPLVNWFFTKVFNGKQRLIRKYGYVAAALITEISEREGVKCYADFGTLLGFIREKGFIPHDYDLDFSLLPEPGDIRRFYLALEAAGFHFERFILMDDKLKEFSVRYNEVSIDFFQQYASTDGTRLDFVDEINDGKWTKYQYPMPTNIIKYEVHGVKVLIPENYDDMLAAEYGQWKTVIRNWNSNMGPTLAYDAESHAVYSSRDRHLWIDLLKQDKV